MVCVLKTATTVITATINRVIWHHHTNTLRSMNIVSVLSHTKLTNLPLPQAETEFIQSSHVQPDHSSE
jgi:uncharacterized protein YrrD